MTNEQIKEKFLEAIKHHLVITNKPGLKYTVDKLQAIHEAETKELREENERLIEIFKKEMCSIMYGKTPDKDTEQMWQQFKQANNIH